MADIHSKKTRSYNMSQIKGKNTKLEVLVRKFLFKKGYRYRINYKKLSGSPDIVLPKFKVVIFINGCFWHGHDQCKYFVLPKTRKDWWLEKISNNKIRDKLNISKLTHLGWKVITIWECQLKTKIKQDETLEMLDFSLNNLLLNMYKK